MKYANNKHVGVINYTGNKQKLLGTLLDLFPDTCDRFIDACCGGLSVSMSVPYQRIVSNDIEDRLIEIYKTLEAVGEELSFSEVLNYIGAFDLDNQNKDGYLELREYYNQEDRSAFVLLTLLYHSFSNQIRFSPDGGFNMAFGRRTFNSSLQSKLRLFFQFLEAKRPEFTSMSYKEIEVLPTDFLYIDPPYLITDATYNSFWSPEEDKAMMEWLDSLPCKWGMSNVFHHRGKSNPQLIEWSAKHNTHILSGVGYVSGAHDSDSRPSKTTEVHICNY